MESAHKTVARVFRIFSVLTIIAGTVGTTARVIWFPNDAPISGIFTITIGVVGYALGEMFGGVSEESI